MDNPIWQPGPPQVAGFFWIEGYPWDNKPGKRIFREITQEDLITQGRHWIARHAGPVAVPEPVEPGGGG